MTRKIKPWRRFMHVVEGRKFANFGYDDESPESKMNRSPNVPHPDGDEQFPMHTFDLDYATELISRYPLGEKQPRRLFIDKIIWGESVGAIRLTFGTVNDIIIDKLSTDLEGMPVWVTKRAMNINREFFAAREERVVHDLLKELDIVDKSPLDAPINDYSDFEKLVTTIAYRTGVVANDPLYIEGITKMSTERYLIVFSVRGMGQGAPDQKLVNEVLIDLSYNPKTGVIKMIEGSIESSVQKQQWKISPSDFIMHFMPSQPRDEIVTSISTLMKYF